MTSEEYQPDVLPNNVLTYMSPGIHSLITEMKRSHATEKFEGEQGIFLQLDDASAVSAA